MEMGVKGLSFSLALNQQAARRKIGKWGRIRKSGKASGRADNKSVFVLTKVYHQVRDMC